MSVIILYPLSDFTDFCGSLNAAQAEVFMSLLFLSSSFVDFELQGEELRNKLFDHHTRFPLNQFVVGSIRVDQIE